jgi:phage-related protein
MAEEPEVIQHELEETRHALAEKLEAIGEKISGTVETVSEAVSSVTETVSSVTETVEGTVQTVAETLSGAVEGVKETVSSVGEKATETVEAVRQAFNLSDQISRRPWAWFGSSVALGFLAGKIFAPRAHHTPEASSFIRGGGGYSMREEPAAPQQHWGNGYRPTDGTTNYEALGGQSPSMVSGLTSGLSSGVSSVTSGVSSMVGNLAHQFEPELNQLKEMALGALFGVVRDMVSQSVPESLKDQVQGVFNNITEKVGGKPIQGTVLDEGSQDQNSPSGFSSETQHEQSGASEMDRSVGTAQKKGKAGMGKSNR